MILLYILGSVILVSLIAFIGVLTLYFHPKKLDKMLFSLVSFAAGALLGAAFLDLLPEAAHHDGEKIFVFALIGLIVFYVIETYLHWHHRHYTHHHFKKHHKKPFTILNLVGDGIHNFVDGMIIAASYLVSVPLGITTTIAVILHEIPQELGDFGILVYGGFKKRKALFFNFLSALTAVLGAMVVYFFGAKEHIVHFLVPFAAGGFIYIACADLLPEIHKEEREGSIAHLIFFLMGVAIIYVAKIFFAHAH
jgi:zinc and cadmium transporter